MNENTMVTPKIGDYRIKEVNIGVVNEMDSCMIIDPTEVIEDYNPSIYFDGENWLIDGSVFTSDKDLYEYVYGAIENRITDSCPDDEETYLVIDVLEFDLINLYSDMVWKLKMEEI